MARKSSARRQPSVAKPVAAEEKRSANGRIRGSSAEMATTAVHIPRETLLLLRRLAVERVNQQGGRPSVSALLATLIESRRDELEVELRDLLKGHVSDK